MPGHGRRRVVEDDERDVLSELDGLADREHPAVEEGGVAHEDDFLVVDEGVGARPGAAAEAHARQVVHQVGVGREHEHGVAADAAVEQQVDRSALVGAPHVVGVHEALLDLKAQVRGVAVRAARAERGHARRQRGDVRVTDGVEGLDLAVEGGIARPAKRRAARLPDQRNQPLDKDRRVQAAGRRQTRQAARELLAPQRHVAGAGSRLSVAGDDLGDLGLHESPALLDHDDRLALVGQFAHQVRVERIAHAELEYRILAQQACLEQRLDQVPVGEAAGDKAQRLTHALGILDAVDAQLAGCLDRPGVPARKALLLPPRLGRQQHPLVQVDVPGVEAELVPRVELRILVGPALHRPAPVGKVGRQDVAHKQLRPARDLERQVDEVLDLLRIRRLDGRYGQVPGDVAAVDGHLCGVRPRVVAVDDNRTALGVGAGEVAQRQPVGGYVHADALHADDAPAWQRLAAV